MVAIDLEFRELLHMLECSTYVKALDIVTWYRYSLDDDVRQSLYKSVNDWLEGIGPSRIFMGGDKPNLADLVS